VITHLDLFSGIGGFSLASSWLGARTVGFSEIDPFCCRVLAKHWPEVPINHDIRTLTADVVRGWLDRADRDDVADAEHRRRDVKRITSAGILGTTPGDQGRARHQSTGATIYGSQSSSIRLDLVTGGFPCQPWSHAGKRMGAEDDRHLWGAGAGRSRSVGVRR